MMIIHVKIRSKTLKQFFCVNELCDIIYTKMSDEKF